MRRHRLHNTTALAALMLAIGCARTPPPAPIAAAPVAPVPRPAPPRDLPTTMRVPLRAADGRYDTINRAVSAAGAVWHVRAALNVAALGCRGADEATMIAGYNRLLRTRKATLAAADKALQAEFRSRDPRGWQAAHDAHATRLYNFFSQPLDPTRFCAEALALAAEADAVPTTDFPAFAAGALARLEAPFTDAYARFDEYRTRLAAWEAGTPASPRLAYASLDAVIAWSPAPPLTPLVRHASLR